MSGGFAVIGLDEDEALQTDVAGAKAAWLARARRNGLPVLPGVVIPAACGLQFLQAAMRSHGAEGQHAARLAVMTEVTAAEAAFDELRERAGSLGPVLVVRSSSPAEDDPRWAGAFSSVLDVRPADLAAAVGSCWSSALSDDAVFRRGAAGAMLAATCPAALIQPLVTPVLSGTATCIPGGPVTLVASQGSPARLMAGDVAGLTATVAGSAVHGAALELAGPGTFREVAAVTMAAAEAVRDGTGAASARDGAEAAVAVEWAVAGDRVVLLQVRPAAAAHAAASGPPAADLDGLADLDGMDGLAGLAGLTGLAGRGTSREPGGGQDRPGQATAATPGDPLAGLAGPPGRGTGDRAALGVAAHPSGRARPAAADATDAAVGSALVRVAGLVASYAGPLGESAVLPWLVAYALRGRIPDPGHLRDHAAGRGPADAGADFEAALDLVPQAVAEAWAVPEGTAASHATAVLSLLAEGDVDRILPEIAPPHAPGPAEGASTGARKLLRLLAGVSDHLTRQGVLANRGQIWGLRPDQVRALLAAPEPAGWNGMRRRTLRWQPFLQATLARFGTAVRAQPASDGAVAGLARRIRRPEDIRALVPGEVAVVEHPHPGFAPVLWTAGALVAEAGSPAAHLMEVARSLRVPAVCATGPGVGAAVDAGGSRAPGPGEPRELADGGCLLCVDGDNGVLTLCNRLPPWPVAAGK